MTLEQIATDLGIEDPSALYEWRDSLIRDKAAELQALHLANAAALQAKDEANAAQIAELQVAHETALKEAKDAATAAQSDADLAITERDQVRAMAVAVIAEAEDAMSQGDIDRIRACIAEAKKPATQREREALEAQIAALQAQLT